ncbi:hypothetical protein JR338_06480 [Chloroflexota bacterium]|nr:hypothetical protein JR338_06480 [Chloroflexota bacterium]
MTEEFVHMFNNAMQEWDEAVKQQDMNKFNNTISFMLMAIKKAPEPNAIIHSNLAMIYYDAAICQAQQPGRRVEKMAENLINKAINEANTALKIEPLSFNSQLVKTYIAADNILHIPGGASNLVPKNGLSAAGVTEFFVRAGSMGVAASKVGVSQAKFKSEVKRLLEIFDSLFSEYYLQATDYIDYSNRLFSIADFCTNSKLAGAKDIFTSLMNVVVDDLKYDDLTEEDKNLVEQEVYRIRALAEGRLMM